MLRPGMRTSSIFNTQHVATGRPNARNMLCPTSCDMLHSNVAIVWPELANTGPTMLLYVALKCCDLLAGALHEASQPG